MLKPLARLPLFALLSALALVNHAAFAQLSVLSAGNTSAEWQKSQIEILKEQLAANSNPPALRKELEAQLKWLSAWKPGSLSEDPLWKTPSYVKPPRAEPTIDPEGIATDLRRRLLGPDAKPTIRDTEKLEKMLSEIPGDIGVRQLHLHWLDQRQYRKTYPDEIADAALRLAGLLDQMRPVTEDVTLAKAFCLYRRARALAYRELPEVLKAKPIEDPVKFEAALLGAYSQLVAEAGQGRSEFILLDIRILRRDQFYGQALVELTDHAFVIDKQWFFKKRRDLLTELGWEAPAKEAAIIYSKAYPDAVEAELEELDQ